MSIETDLRKNGITIIEPLDSSTINTIAKNVSKKIILNFPNIGFDLNTLYNRFSNLPMYIADIPEGMSEASYYYKNSSVYFRDGMGLNDLEKYAVHELIHNLQEVKDEKGNLTKLGLCTINGLLIDGLALNEAAVQLITSNILEETFENLTYYDINFSTISPNCYPLLCNLIYQMAYVTGEDVLFESTFKSNNNFKNKFSEICGKNNYNLIAKLFDKILKYEEKIIKINNKIQTIDLSNSKLSILNQRIQTLKQNLKNSFFAAQELIITSYFDSQYNNIKNENDIESFRRKLYNYQDLIGFTDNYTFFNNYYIKMMEKLDIKYDNLNDDSYSKSTYLIQSNKSYISMFVNYFKKLLYTKSSQKIK